MFLSEFGVLHSNSPRILCHDAKTRAPAATDLMKTLNTVQHAWKRPRLEVRKISAGMEARLSLFLFPFLPIPSPFHLCLFPVLGVLSAKSSYAVGSGQRLAGKSFQCILSWKSCFLDSAFTCVVIRIGHTTYRYGFSRYGFEPSKKVLAWRTVPYRPTASLASLLSRTYARHISVLSGGIQWNLPQTFVMWAGIVEKDLKVRGLWIRFCLTGPISLCVDSCVYEFFALYCLTAYVLYYCNTVGWTW